MKTIWLYNGIQVMTFPDGQPHIRLSSDIAAEDAIRLVWPIRNPAELVQLMEISNALDGVFARKKTLFIPYLMGARSDRHMVPGDSCDLAVVAACINLCGFERVEILDVHSDVALQLIHRSVNIDNSELLRHYKMPNAILIVPDAGGIKRADKYMALCPNIKDVVTCAKWRNTETGEIRLRVLEPERCVDRNCVIIDDLCDGGATFLSIHNQISPSHLALIVTHGIFSKGWYPLAYRFQQIIVSDSFTDMNGAPDGVLVVRLREQEKS
jgi:ribose-phosphate pyrophosphokinase